jgi:hypothetical protein
MYKQSETHLSSQPAHPAGPLHFVQPAPLPARGALLLLILLLLLGVIPSQAAAPGAPDAPNDTPTPVVSETYNEWTLNSGLLYWANRCYGGEFSWAATLKRMPAGGGTTRTIGVTDTLHCITYTNLAADSEGVYYYSVSDQRIEARFSGAPDTAVPVYSLNASTDPVGERLAVDGSYIYWLTSSSLVRVRKDGADFGTVASGLSSPADLLVTGGVVYWLDASGLARTNVNCGALPCAKEPLSAVTGSHLVYYYQNKPLIQAGPRLVYVTGQKLHRVSCSDLTITCSETDIYTVPADGNAWTLGRPATDGANLYWEEGYPNISGLNVGRLRRMPVSSSTAVDIALNLYYVPAPVYLHAGYVYFASVDNATTDILKLPLDAAAVVRTLSADAMEITQGIQNLANDTPLVAKKPTYVRAYATAGSGPSAYDVEAVLYGTRNNLPLPGSPLHSLNGRRALVSGASYDRAQLNAGWLFQLPDSWIGAGNISLRLVVDPLQAYSDANRLDNELSRTASFSSRQIVCDTFIPVRTSAPLPSTNITNFWQMMDYAKRLWPTASLRAYHQNEPLEELEACSWHGIPYPCFGPYELPGDTWKVFTSLKTRELLTDDPSECDAPQGSMHYVGMVHPSTDTGITTGTGMTSVFNLSWVKFSNDLAASNDPFAPQSGETLAHETAHNLGRMHVDCGSPSDVDASYPYPTNQIDFTGPANHYGFDIKSLRPIPPNAAKDFMGYCTPKWVSDYTWKGLYNQLFPFAPAAASVPSAPLASAAGAVLVSGAVTPTASTGSLDYAWNYPTAALSASTLQKWQRLSQQNAQAVNTSSVAYHVRLLDAADSVLADVPVTPVAPHFHEGDSPIEIFFASLPSPTSTVARIELLQDSAVLDRRAPGGSTPTVSILQPAGGETFTDTLQLSWQGQDADTGDLLHYSIQYSPDGGLTWRSLAADIPGTPGSTPTSLAFNVSGMPGSSPSGGLVRIAASDGYHTGLAVSQPFTISNHKPEPFILTPAAGESTPAGQSALLRGAANDAEDGSLDGASLSWTIDGVPAGSGEEVNAAGFAPGSHPVILTAYDSLSQTAAAQGTLTILPLAVPAGSTPTLDGACDDPGYAAASQVLLKPYDPDTQAVVHLLRDNSAVWLCFSGLKPGALSPGAFVGARIDSDNSRDSLAQPGDYGFFVGEDGGVLTVAGDGAGGFASAGPGGLQAQVSAAGSAWSAELRIDAAVIGGLDHLVGLSLGHYSLNALNDDYVWPYASVTNQPDTWAETALAALPAITQLSPSGAVTGSPAFTLVISGENFVSASQALWNGTPLSTTFGSSTLVSATLSTAQLSAAGSIPVVVRNPGNIDSGPALFALSNPQPALSGLLPDSNPAGGPAFTLAISGSGFASGARVLWNGQELPTTFTSSGQLSAQVGASLLDQAQAVSITVLNPGPGAQVSNTALFIIQPRALTLLPLINNK